MKGGEGGADRVEGVISESYLTKREEVHQDACHKRSRHKMQIVPLMRHVAALLTASE